MISIKMHSPEPAGAMHTHELYLRSNSQDLITFIGELDAMASIVEINLYAAKDVCVSNTVKIAAFDLGIESLHKFK